MPTSSPTWDETTDTPTWDQTFDAPKWDETSEIVSSSLKPSFGPPGSNPSGVEPGPSNLLEMEAQIISPKESTVEDMASEKAMFTPEQLRRLDEGSLAENLMTAPPGLEAPMVTPEDLDKPFPGMSPGAKRALSGLLQTGAGLWNFVASPVGVGLGITGAGASLPGVAGALGKATLATFAIESIQHFPETVRQYGEAVDSGDTEAIFRTGSQLMLNAGVAMGAGRGAVSGLKGIGKSEAQSIVAKEKSVKSDSEMVALDEMVKQLETGAIEKPSAAVAPETAEALRLVAEDKVPSRTEVKEVAPKFEETVPVEESGPGMVGMGAADRAELKTYSEDTGIKDASITDQRELRGLDALERGEVQKWESARQEAQGRIDQDSTWLDTLENELIAQPRPMDTVETAGMLNRLTKLRQEFDSVSDQLSKAFDAGEPTDALNIRAQELSDRISRTEGAVSIGGAASESGRSLNALKMMMARDFTLAAMESRRRADKGGAPLTYDERIELIQAHKEMQEKLKVAEAAESEFRAKAVEAESRAVLAEQQAKVAQSPEFHPSILQHAERFVSRMEATSRKYATELYGQFNSPTPDVFAKAAFIGATKLARGAVELAKWTEEMIVILGEKFGPYAEQVFEMSKKVLDEELSASEKIPSSPRISKAVKRAMTAEDQKADITAKIDAKIKSGEGAEITNLVQQLARHLVEGGIKELDPLLDALHTILKQVDPNIERRTVQDALTGYGKFTRPKQDAVSRTVAELKGQGLEVGKLLDLESGKPLKATGFLRGKMSDIRRRLVAKVNEYKRKYGVVTTDPATQLRSALDSRKRALNNQINDLADQINSRKKFIKEKTKSPTDTELDELIKFRDELRKEFDDTFGKTEMSDEARLKIATAAAEKAEVRWNERLENANNKVFDVPKSDKKKVTSPELEAIRSRTEAIREQVKELKDLDIGIQEAKREVQLKSQQEALEKSVSELERRIREGDLKPSGARMNRPGDPALESLLQKRDKLNRDISEARKTPAGQKESERIEKLVKDIEKKISERESKLDSGDLSSNTTTRVNRPLPKELEMARQQLEQVNQRIADARKSAAPKKTREEIALQSLKTRIANETAKLTEKLAKGDFSATPKRPPIDISKDAPTMKAKAALERVRNEWRDKGRQEQLRLRTLKRKIWDGIKQAAGIPANLVTSFDFSGPRQAFVALLSISTRPVRGWPIIARSMGKYFSSAFSESKAKLIETEIKNRPNSINGVDKISKVDFMDLEATTFTKREDYAHSVLDEWAKLPFNTGKAAKTAFLAIPKAFVKGVRGSNRGFITFLNSVRAEELDLLLKINFKDRAPTDIEIRDIGNVVNMSTGRGNMSPTTAKVLSGGLWSPNLFMNRLKTMAGQPLLHPGSLRTKRIVAGEYARVLMSAYVLSKIASMFDEKQEESKTSSDYGKIVRGDIRDDIFAGYQQWIVLFNRFWSAETTTLKGKSKDIGSERKFGDEGLFVVGSNFLRSKAKPIVGAGIDIATRTDFLGNPTTVQGVAVNLLVPLQVREIKSIMTANGFTEGMVHEALQLFGVGVSVYDDQRKP